jgi:hypothetical protein
MTEKELENIFHKFLTEEKHYSSKGILTQIPIVSTAGVKIQPDLLLIDIKIGEYIGLVEFKAGISPQVKQAAKNQVKKYLNAIKAPDIPAFLVFPTSETDFQILVLSDKDEWEPIEKNEFPEFDSLSAKKKTEEKQSQREIDEKIVYEYELKKRKTQITSIWTLTSLIIGVLASFIAIFISQKDFQGFKDDSDLITKSEIIKIQTKLSLLENQLQKSGIGKDSIIFVDSSKTITGVDKRLKTIENAMEVTPDKLLNNLRIEQNIKNLQTEINHLDELQKVRIESLNARLDFLNGWVLGIVIALFSAAIGFVFTNYIKDKNTVANTQYSKWRRME